MTGLFLIILAVLTLIFFIVGTIDNYNEETWGVATVICLVLTLSFLTAIPISRIDTKKNIEYARVFQETLDYNRSNEQDFNVIERAKILEEINSCNSVISSWKIKGQKWYNNKWYYHPDTQNVKYIK